MPWKIDINLLCAQCKSIYHEHKNVRKHWHKHDTNQASKNRLVRLVI
jgi:hypothetical protein